MTDLSLPSDLHNELPAEAVEAAAKALRARYATKTPWYDLTEADRADWLADARRALTAALSFLSGQVAAGERERIAGEIEALRDRHFQQYGNEENGPRNYDWALTHAANIARTGDPLARLSRPVVSEGGQG